MKKKLSLFIMITTLIMALVPGLEGAQAAERQPLSEQEQQEAVNLENELRENGITELHIVTGLDEQLSQAPSYDKQMADQPYGETSKSASNAGAQMIINLQKTGQNAWDTSIKDYVEKLPVSAGAKSTLEKYLGYSFVMDTLNIVTHSQGDFTEVFTIQMQNSGVPNWLAGVTARTLVYLLL
ncbi:hypothetical protein [Halobacillus andaensis]|uniref:hypothetical protein n=1 Tax=Halobacillus andaensis TaxID=1176239 RepID=UPI003D72EFA9